MLSGLHTVTLTAIAIATGFAALWVIAKFSDQEGIDEAKRKVRAHLYSFRLFVDDPLLIFGAQKQLLIWNGRYLARLARPAIVMTIPTVILLLQLEAVYGHRALAEGERTIVTAQFDAGNNLDPSLSGSGIEVETPAVRIPAEHQVCWRVRAASGTVILKAPGTEASKSLQIGDGLHYISVRRVSSLLDWLRYPGEARLQVGGVRWIEVTYPDASIDIFGWGVHWLIWFSIVCMVTMFGFRRWFGVTF